VQLDLNRAIPCGMIINELISNAIKHAFPDGRKGEIEIQLKTSSNRFNLSVRDDGIALPPGFKPSEVDSLGMMLISDLTNQLEGSLKIIQGDGFKMFEVDFVIHQDNSMGEIL
ncbi:sensor histidine kinase, partial [bacterium]|nr:sensor histidine kinase [bacterium]